MGWKKMESGRRLEKTVEHEKVGVDDIVGFCWR